MRYIIKQQTKSLIETPFQIPNSSKKSWVRRVLYGILAFISIVALLGIIGVALLQTRLGREQARRLIIAQAEKEINGKLHIGALDGNLLDGFSAHEVMLTQGRDTVATVQHISADYVLTNLLQNEMWLKNVAIESPRFWLKQMPDSSWNIAHILKKKPKQKPSAEMTYRIDEIRVDDANGSIVFYPQRQDQLVQVKNLNWRGNQIIFKDKSLELSAVVPHFEAALRLPQRNDDLNVQFAGNIRPNEVETKHFSLKSALSNVQGSGIFAIPKPNVPNRADFTLNVAPFSFQDIAPFAPFLNPSESLQSTTRIKVEGNQYVAESKGYFKQGGNFNLTTDVSLDTQTFLPLSYSVKGNFREINAAYLTLNKDFSSNLNADIDLRLKGAKLEELYGDAIINILPNTKIQQYALQQGFFDAHVEDGLVRFKANSGVDEMRYEANGTARLFDEMPSFESSGKFSNVDLTKPEILAFFPKGTRVEGNINGTFSAKGKADGNGMKPEHWLNSTEIAIKSEVPSGKLVLPDAQFPLQNAHTEANWQGENLMFSAQSNLANGANVSGKGSVSWKNGAKNVPDHIRFKIEEGAFNQLNLQDYLSESLKKHVSRSQLNGRFSLEGTGVNPETMSLKLDATSEDSQYDIYAVKRGKLRATLENGVLSYQTEGYLGAYQNQNSFLSASGSLKPFAHDLALVITDGRFQNLLLDDFLIEGNTKSRFNGRFTLRADGTSLSNFDLKKLRARSAFWLDESSYQNFALEKAQGNVSFSQKLVDYDFDLWANSGKVSLRGSANPFDKMPRFRLDNGEFRNLNLAMLTGLPELSSSLNGWARDVQIEGSDGKNFNAIISLDLEASRFNQQPIRGGVVRIVADPNAMRLVADLRTPDGGFQVSGDGKMEKLEPVYTLKGRVTNLDLNRWLGIETASKSSVSLNFQTDGRGIVSETMQLKGIVSGQKSFYEKVIADSLYSQFNFADGVLHLDTLNVSSNVFQGLGKGKIVLFDTFNGEESDFNFSGNIRNLAPLNTLLEAKYLSGNGDVQGSIRGDVGNWRLRMDTIGDGLKLLRYDEMRIGKAQGRFLAEFNDFEPTYSADMKLETVSIPNYVFQNGRVEGTLKDSLFTFDAQTTLDKRFKAEASGVLTFGASDYHLDLSHFTANIGADVWALQSPSTIVYTPSTLGVEDFRLVSGNQVIFVNGFLDEESAQQLTVDVQQFKFDATSDLLRFNGFGGTMNGTLSVNGTPQNPTIQGNLSIPVIYSFQKAVGKLDMKMDYELMRLNVDALFKHSEGQELSAKGFLPINLSTTNDVPLGDVRFALNTQDLNLDWLNPFADPAIFQRIAGRVSGNINIGGTFQNPDFRGTATLKQATLGIPFIGTFYEKADANMNFEGDKVRVQQFNATSGKGTVSGNGTISLAALNLGYFDLDLKINNFELINTETYKGAATGTAKLRGTTERPILDGDVVLNQFEIFLNSELMQSYREVVKLSEQDIQQVEATFGKRVASADTSTISFYEATDVKLRARSNGNVWLRSRYNPRMDIEMTGDIDFVKPFKQPEYITGNLDAVAGRSKVEFIRRFDITRGRIKFNGDMLNPDMDILAQYNARSGIASEAQKVLMKISGDVENMKFAFESDPPRSDAEIISYLVLGQDAQNTVTKTLGTYTYSLIESLIAQQAQQLGIADVVELTEQDGTPSVKIGRYFGRHFFVALNSKLQSDAGLGAIVEYQARKWALLRLESDKTTAFYVLMEYAY